MVGWLPCLFYWHCLLISGLSLNLAIVYGIKNHKDDNHGSCLSDLKASIKLNTSHNIIEIRVRWTIFEKERLDLSGFYVSSITGDGRLVLWQKTKGNTMHSTLKLSLQMIVLEKYTFTVECISEKMTRPKSVSVQPEDICQVLRRNDIQSPFHCLQQLDDLRVRKCKDNKIFVSWRNPNVTGNGKYIIQHSITDCDNLNCCSKSSFNDEFRISQGSTNFSVTNIKENSKYCFEILMCPVDSDDHLNCESKYPPFLVDCRREKQSRLTYHWIFGVAAALIATGGVIFICHRKHKNSKRENVSENLLTEVQEMPKDDDKNEKVQLKNKKGPLLLIIICVGCVAVEEFVVNLIHILRLNGVDAVSELTEEDRVQRYGRGVYLNERFKQADYILVLCTQEYSSESKAAHQNLYQYALNAIQNQVVEEGGDLRRYLLAHLGEPDLIPETLKTTSVDFGRDLLEVLQSLLRRIFCVETFHVDAASPLRNELSLRNCTLDKVEVLLKCREKIASSKHLRCRRETCEKGQRSSCQKI